MRSPLSQARVESVRSFRVGDDGADHDQSAVRRLFQMYMPILVAPMREAPRRRAVVSEIEPRIDVGELDRNWKPYAAPPGSGASIHGDR